VTLDIKGASAAHFYGLKTLESIDEFKEPASTAELLALLTLAIKLPSKKSTELINSVSGRL
jgi:hypothetical protein